MADILKDELANDPLGRNYAGMDDEAAAADLNTSYRTRDRVSLSASEVYNAIDQPEWGPLSTTEKQEVWDILHMGDINPFGREAARFSAIFPTGPDGSTITALKAARIESITRATELGLGKVKVGHVAVARTA